MAIAFDNKITTGNVLTIIGAVVAGVVMVGTVSSKNVAQDGRIDLVEQQTKFLQQRLDEQQRSTSERLNEIRDSQRRVEEQLGAIRDQIATKADRPK